MSNTLEGINSRITDIEAWVNDLEDRMVEIMAAKQRNEDSLRKYKCVSPLSSVTQSCPTLCNPMDCSMPVFPVHHQLPELAQNHVHQVSDAIQPSHPLPCPSPPAFNLSQHQGPFQ